VFHWPQLVPKLVILAQSCLTRPSANATSTAEVQGQECCHRNSEPARKVVKALTSRLPISTTWHKRDNCIRSATVKPNHRLLSMPCAQSGMEAAESRNPQVTAVATRELSSGCARHSGLTLCYAHVGTRAHMLLQACTRWHKCSHVAACLYAGSYLDTPKPTCARWYQRVDASTSVCTRVTTCIRLLSEICECCPNVPSNSERQYSTRVHREVRNLF
jgi:hypothetical protein